MAPGGRSSAGVFTSCPERTKNAWRYTEPLFCTACGCVEAGRQHPDRKHVQASGCIGVKDWKGGGETAPHTVTRVCAGSALKRKTLLAGAATVTTTALPSAPLQSCHTTIGEPFKLQKQVHAAARWRHKPTDGRHAAASNITGSRRSKCPPHPVHQLLPLLLLLHMKPCCPLRK
jgi:hypothetical protein